MAKLVLFYASSRLKLKMNSTYTVAVVNMTATWLPSSGGAFKWILRAKRLEDGGESGFFVEKY